MTSQPELIARAREFHPWDAMAPTALAAILQRGPFQQTAETGCGGSTIVLSQASEQHTAFAVEGPDRTISELRKHNDLLTGHVLFVEGDTKQTLPRHDWQGELDLVLLDGPHAYPLPQLEFVYLFPRIKLGGWLVIDDIQIPSVYELFRFLKKRAVRLARRRRGAHRIFPENLIRKAGTRWVDVARNKSAHDFAVFVARSIAALSAQMTRATENVLLERNRAGQRR